MALNKMDNALKHIEVLKKFVSPQQLESLSRGCHSEERDFFFDKIEELANTFTNMPKTYEQDGKGDKTIAYLHYFHGNSDWYITEKDMEAEQHQAFGLADLGMGFPELGYISLVELGSYGIEIDLYWTSKTLKEIKENGNS